MADHLSLDGWLSEDMLALCAVLLLALGLNGLRNVLSPYVPFL